MAISDAKRLMREQIQAQQKKVQETKGKNLNVSASHFELPEGLSQWLPKGSDKGEEHAFDIVLFKAGKNFPNMNCNVNEGEWAYLLDFYVHRNIGPERQWVLCPNSFRSKTASGDKKGCPICERMAMLQANESDKEKRIKIWRKYRPQRRCMYYAIVRDGDKEEKKGVQVLDCFFDFMELKLQDLASAKRGQDEILYADTDDGKLIYFKAVKKSFLADNKENVEYSEYEAHQFLDRIDDDKQPYTIDIDLCIEAKPLDSFLNLKSYDEILEILGPVDNGNKVVRNKEDDEPPKTRSGRFSKTEEETPSRMSKVNEDPSNDEDDEDNAEEFACPHGHTLGKHFLKKSECEDCEGDVYNECRRLKKEMKSKAA